MSAPTRSAQRPLFIEAEQAHPALATSCSFSSRTHTSQTWLVRPRVTGRALA